MPYYYTDKKNDILYVLFHFLYVTEGFDTEILLEGERQKMRDEYEAEMSEMRLKMESEKQTKAKMQHEVEIMKQQYEEKLKALEKSAKTGALSRQSSIANGIGGQQTIANAQNGNGGTASIGNEVKKAAVLK